MTGIYEHSLDAKGRLFIPAKLRDELALYFMSRCRWRNVFPPILRELDKFMEKIKEMPKEQAIKMRPCLPMPQMRTGRPGENPPPQALRNFGA